MGFFTTVVKLDQEQRKRVFYFICIPVRLAIAAIFFYLPFSLALSYVAAIWGVTWLLFMVRMRRWEEQSDTPPWWSGVFRIIWRFSFSLVLAGVGFIGIISENERITSNKIIGIVFCIDVIQGLIDYTLFY